MSLADKYFSRLQDTKAVAEAAVALLKRDGWIQGTFKAPGGQRCLVGVLREIPADGCVRDELQQRLKALIRRRLRKGSSYFVDLVSWNDRRGRKKSEVISLLKEAAK